MEKETIKALAETTARATAAALTVKNGPTVDLRLPTTKEQRRQANEEAKKKNTHVPVLGDFEVVYSLPEINDEIKILVSAGDRMRATDDAFNHIVKKLGAAKAYDKKAVVWKSTRAI